MLDLVVCCCFDAKSIVDFDCCTRLCFVRLRRLVVPF